MAGRQVSWIVILVVVVVDLIAFGLAIGGEAKRSKANSDVVETNGDYLYCKYKSDKASGFGAGAMIFLLIGHIVVTAVTQCICCGGPYRPGAARVFGVIFFVVVWISFLLAELLLLGASVANTVHTKKSFYAGSDQLSCKQLRKGIFTGGAVLSFLTMVFSVVYYILITKAKDSIRDFRNSGIGMTQL